MLTVTFLFAALFTYTLHTKDVFQPPIAPPPNSWASLSGDTRIPVETQTQDGSKLRGWLFRTDRAGAPFVLFFYGSNEDLSHEKNRLAWLSDTFHVNAICFDYPGYGFSSGKRELATIRTAALAEYDYVRSHLASGGAPMISYGWSIGTHLAIYVAKQRKIAGLILQAPPASADSMAQWSSRHDVPWYAHGLVKIKVDPALQGMYEGASAIRSVNSPLLLIAGTLDDVVPVQQAKEVFNSSPAKQKAFVEVPGANHNNLHFTQPPTSIAVANFLKAFSPAN